MTEFRDPTWLIERAWSSLSLDALQRVIELTISRLQRIEPVPGESQGDIDLDARGEALKACCAELRHAAGMADAEAHRATHCELVRRHIAGQPEVWGEAFARALDEYRRAASEELQGSLAIPAVAAVGSRP
jgi:hypothetical protein